MMLKQLIICSTLLLRHSAVWAGSIDQTVSGLNILEEDANQADEDVKAINAVDGLTDTTVRYTGSEEQSRSFLIDVRQEISEDVQLVTNDAQEITTNNQGVAATADTAVEDQITNAYNSVSKLWPAIAWVMLTIAQATTAMDNFLGDLKDKANDLNELGQGSAIYTALGDLRTAYYVSHDVDS